MRWYLDRFRKQHPQGGWMKRSTAASGSRPMRADSCSANPPGASNRAVRVGPGETTFDRTPCGPCSCARDFETDSTAAFDAA